jgi:hypothetical protein
MSLTLSTPPQTAPIPGAASPAAARARRAAQAARDSGRRRKIDPATCERDYDPAELEFMKAIQDYKARSGRMFPTWSEVLEVLLSLGYSKAAEGVAR